MKLHEYLFAVLTLGFCPGLIGIAETPDAALIPLPPSPNVTLPVTIDPPPAVVTPCEPTMIPCSPTMTSCETCRKLTPVRQPLVALYDRVEYVLEPLATRPCKPGGNAVVRRPVVASVRRLIRLCVCCR